MFLKIFLGIIIFIFSLILLHYSKTKKYKTLTEKIGCSNALPFFGVLFVLFDLEEFLNKWSAIIRYPNTKSAFAWFGPFLPVFYTYNINFIQKILLSPDCIEKSNVYSVLEKEVGPGLMTVGGKTWNRHRRLLNPSFNHRLVINSLPIFNAQSHSFVKELEGVVGLSDVILLPKIRKYMMRTSFASLLDYELKADNKEHILLMDHLDNFATILFRRVTRVSQYFDAVFRFNKLYHPFVESKNFFYDFLQKLLHNKISLANENHAKFQNKPDKCFIEQAIDIYLDANFTFDELFTEVITILIASFDTSTITLQSVILMLAMHPEYQEELFEEVMNLYPGKDFIVRYEDIEHFTYMERFINETMRMVTTAPVIGRITTKDVKLSENLILPPETYILIDFLKMYRDEDVWGPTSKHFNPDHFLPENLIDKHSCSFLPFSKGSRNCIGYRYAEFFLKTTVAKLVRNYRFETKTRYEDLHFLVNVTVNYKKLPSIKVHKR